MSDLYALTSGGDSQYNPPPALKETSVFDGWQDFLSGVSNAVKSTVQTIADTKNAIDDIHDSDVRYMTTKPAEPKLPPVVAIVLGVGLALVAKKLLAKG